MFYHRRYRRVTPGVSGGFRVQIRGTESLADVDELWAGPAGQCRPNRRFRPWRAILSKSKIPSLQRLIGATGLFAVLGLITYELLSRAALPGDNLYWLVRWPFWLAAVVLAPLIAIRIAFWNFTRRQAGRGEETDGADEAPPAE